MWYNFKLKYLQYIVNSMKEFEINNTTGLRH